MRLYLLLTMVTTVVTSIMVGRIFSVDEDAQQIVVTGQKTEDGPPGSAGTQNPPPTVIFRINKHTIITDGTHEITLEGIKARREIGDVNIKVIYGGTDIKGDASGIPAERIILKGTP